VPRSIASYRRARRARPRALESGARPGYVGEIHSGGVREIAEALLDVLNGGLRGALATVVAASGSTPQQPGAKLLLRPDGTLVGTVGGGAIEHVVIDALRETVRTGRSQKLTRDLGPDLGMCCGGRMEVFVEPVEAAPRLVVFGAGHVAEPTAAIARTLGFDVEVVDPRAELATAERFPGCRLHVGDAVSFAERAAFGERDHVLVVTHDHRLDERILERVLAKRPGYVGLVGSRRKVLSFARRLAGRAPALDFGRVYAPVGVDLGAVTPAEIAVSIAAELVALRRGKAVPHLGVASDPKLRAVLEADAPRPIPLRIPVRRSSGERG
jgi:xanthine dehydrogenase accessory factor